MLSDDEKMFAVQAIYKAVAKDAGIGKGGLRDEFNERWRQRYREEGITSCNAQIMGEKVGTISIRPDNPKPKTEFQVVDFDALEDWYPEGEDMFPAFVVANLPEFAQFWFNRTGELPPGCDMTSTTPEPKEPTVTLKIDEKKVADVLGGLPGGLMPLLGGE